MAACTNIDWSTFTFVATSNQTLVSAISLTGAQGDAVFDPATRTIEYTTGSASCDVEVIQFTVKDLDGNLSNLGLWYVNFDNLVAPVAVNDSFNIAAGTLHTFDASSNDTGSVSLSSYQIVTSPTKMSVTNNLDGTFTINVPEDAEGADSFTYKFSSPDGVESNTATVSITIQNAGTGASATICPVAGVNLTSFLTGSVTAGGSWSADVGNPSAPSIATPTSVDFSAANAGTYLFTYSIGSSSATITLELLDYSVAIDTVSAPTSNPIAGSIVSLVEFTTIGVTNANNIQIEVDFDSGTSFDYYPPDKWNPATGKGIVTIEYGSGAGTYDITVTATDSCAVAQTDTWATITIT
jgi:hypothetical protein